MPNRCDTHQEGMDILMFKDTGMVGLQSMEKETLQFGQNTLRIPNEYFCACKQSQQGFKSHF